ncbi:hydantoinase B/oxoprolinase family protein [Mesorhizobium australicum]|uniref:N-methylhydantoinase B n=1 Tax=Mesorhizobium australicum TaxID=536018 RepID=A0A1X7PQ56_9HYPH|nr:hydantoinase B/oxoprolinase family protein [Mesorhizobium australicum]SMH53934.1 N-methylhydantoinase B [Mesorhizobium australicum]
MSRTPLSLIDKQVMWNRLIAVVEEQAQTLQRTAFSTIVRESGDLAAGVFDVKGRMLAQAVTGTPGHINTMALNVGHVLEAHPAETMQDGDVYITNDPWLGTGHTNDFCITTPVFRDGGIVGLFACNCHLMDIGGVLGPTSSTDLYMEGLIIPILKLVEAGKVNETLMAIIRTNTRMPVDTEGDVYAMIACNDVGYAGLNMMMDEFGINDLSELAEHIVETSREAVLANIRALPFGTWHSEMWLDGYDEPIRLKAALTISHDGINVDFTGSSPMVRQNINVPICYTLAYTSFGIGCIVSKGIPNNAGSLAPITVSSPEGTIMHALKPAAVVSRHIVGISLPDLVFGALRQAVPDRVPAEGAGCLWHVNGTGPRRSPPVYGDTFRVGVVTTGGMGALPFRDGLSATGYPSGVRGGPVEIFESMSTLVMWRKQYRQDSGGAGKFRGGLGQEMILANSLPEPFTYFASYERTRFAPRGVDGGADGAIGTIHLSSGEKLAGKGTYSIPAGTRLYINSPGAGGHGNPLDRDRAAILRDLELGLISPEAAEKLYGFDPAPAMEAAE